MIRVSEHEHEDEHLRIMDLDGDEERRALERHLQRRHEITVTGGGSIDFLHQLHDELHFPGVDEPVERCPVCHEEIDGERIVCGHQRG